MRAPLILALCLSASVAARAAPGLIAARSTVVRIFMQHGWAWGGLDGNAPDYMHFGKVTVGGGNNPLTRQVWAERLEYAPD